MTLQIHWHKMKLLCSYEVVSREPSVTSCFAARAAEIPSVVQVALKGFAVPPDHVIQDV